MKSILFIFLFISCTLTYLYKGSEIEKNYRKSDKAIQQAINNFDKIHETQIILDYFKERSPEFKDEEKHLVLLRDNCLSIKEDIINERKKITNLYHSLGINRKSKYKNTDPKYKKIEIFIEEHKKGSEKLNTFFRKANNDCKKINTFYREKDISLINISDVNKKMNKHHKDLLKSELKIKKEINIFSAKLSGSKHKKKNEIQIEIKNLQQILEQMIKQSEKLVKMYSDLKNQYGENTILPILKNSPAYNFLNELKLNINAYNKDVSAYNNHSTQINKLLE